MILLTQTSNGNKKLVDESSIERLIQRSPSSLTEIILKSNQKYVVSESITDIYNNLCPTTMLLVTETNGSRNLIYKGDIRVEGNINGGSYIVYKDKSNKRLSVTESIADLQAALCAANSSTDTYVDSGSLTTPTNLQLTLVGGGLVDIDLDPLKQDILDSLTSGIIRKKAAIDIVDNTMAAPGSPNIGDRYLLDITGATDPSWGGAAPNSIVEWDGSAWVAEVPEEGWTIYVDNENSDYLFIDDGAAQWEQRQSGSVVLQRRLFVSENGDDATAVPYDASKPYRYPWTAIAAAGIGDSVHIEAGTYILGPGGDTDDGTKRLIKDRVSVICSASVVIQHTQTSGSISELWSDDGIRTECLFKGYATFFSSRPTPQQYLHLSNSFSKVHVELHSWTSNVRLFSTAFQECIWKTYSWKSTSQSFSNRFAVTLNEAIFEFKAKRYIRIGASSFTHFEFRNTGGTISDGLIKIGIEEYRYSASLSLGNIYIDNAVSGGTRVDVKINKNIGTISNPNPIILLQGNSDAYFDVELNGINHFGTTLRGGGTNNINGKISQQGTIGDFNDGNVPIRFSGFTGRLDLLLDLDVLVTNNTIAAIYAQASTSSNFIKGKIKTSHPTQGALLIASGASTEHASLKNLIMECISSECVTTLGTPSVPNVLVYENTYSNKAPQVGSITEILNNIQFDSQVVA